jgi:alginate O-acetyltransferase complex protein AlgI
MPLTEILLLAGLALLIRFCGRGSLRAWLILAASGLAVYALQPGLPVRNLGFWLSTATLALSCLGWLLTVPPEKRFTRSNFSAAALLFGVTLVAGLTRYLGPGTWLIAARPPATGQVGLALAALLGVFALLSVWMRARGTAKLLPWPLVFGIIALIVTLVILKTPALSLLAAQILRSLSGQNPQLATTFDVRWLGFSYICFRLVHTLRDRQTGRLPAVDLRTYVSYVIFFPSLLAGPIDRLDRFARDFNAPEKEPISTAGSFGSAGSLGIIARPFPLGIDTKLEADLVAAGPRLVIGLFKKFVLADTLGLIALSPTNALQVSGAGWLWLLVYLYAFQIYFDFSGYTDIAIALGQVLGIKLPENFAAPYRKPNLTQFWNSWHMSLTQWFRGYFFNPLVRTLRGWQITPTVALFVTQVSTMLLIGIWHGVTWNFVLWGVWHGLGLFVQNRWSEWVRPRFAGRSLSPRAQKALQLGGVLLTFHYVALGWVWFVLPTPAMAGQVLLRMAGVAW